MGIQLKIALESLEAVSGKLIRRINEEGTRLNNKMAAREAPMLRVSILKQLRKRPPQRFQTTSQIPKKGTKVEITQLSRV